MPVGKGLLSSKGGATLEDINKPAEEPQEPQETLPPQGEPEVQEPQEPVQEEIQEPVKEPEQPKAEEPQEPQEPEKPAEPAQFDLAAFNEKIGKTFESIDQVKAELDKPTMESEYQEQKTAYEELQSKYDDLQKTNELLLEQTDPSSFFSSEEAMKLEMFKRSNPKADAAVASKVFSTEDLSSIDDLEMVKMGRKFRNPKLPGSDADLEQAIKEELGLDPETPRNEWSNTAQIRLATMAGEYRDTFDKIKSEVSLPERVDIEQLKAQRQQEQEQKSSSLSQGWESIANEVLTSTKEIKLPIGEAKEGEEQKFFTWDLDSAPKEDVEQLKADYISLGVNPESEDAKQSFQKAVEFLQLQKNLPKIMQKYADDLLSRKEEEHLKETHNPEPLKDSQRPDESEREKRIKEDSAHALEAVTPRVVGTPLFKR